MIQKYLPLVALYKISKGQPKPFHCEDIAVKCKEIAPNSFTWSKYKENIDLRQVMRTLDELKRDDLIVGKNTTAWSLKLEGISFVESNLLNEDFSNIDKTKKGIYSKDVQRIETSVAFLKWKEGEVLIKEDIQELLRIDSYTSELQKQNKITKFQLAIKTNVELEEFAESVLNIFNLDSEKFHEK